LADLQSREFDFSQVQCPILEAITTVVCHVEVAISDGMSPIYSSVIFCNVRVMEHLQT